MESFDPQEELAKIHETIEIVLDKLMPGSPQDIIDSASENMEGLIEMIHSKQGAIDTWTKLQLQQLLQAKVKGEVDNEQLASALIHITQNAQIDDSRPELD